MRKCLALSIALLMICCHVQARKVRGTVTSGKERLHGVLVTDGTNFTKTRRNGRFSFRIEDDAEFVYIVTPSGYVADWSSGVPEFYQKAAGKKSFTFDLQKTGILDDYSIIAMADPQVYDDAQFSQFAGEPVADMCRTAASMKDNAVCLVLGDICEDAEFEYIEKIKKEMLRTGLPLYPVSGNNDHNHNSTGDIDAIAGYRQIMGPENYAFFMGDDMVVVLDNIVYEGNWSYYEGYAPHVVSWMKKLGELIPDGADIIIAHHSPLRDEASGRMLSGYEGILASVRGHRVTFISGHNHTRNFEEYEENIIEHNVASIAGSKWRSELCGDGTPRGYMVITKSEGRMECYYKPVGQPKFDLP